MKHIYGFGLALLLLVGAASAAGPAKYTAITDSTARANAAKSYHVKLTAGAEALNVVTVAVAVVDRDDNAYASAVPLLCRVLDASALQGVVGDFTLAETGAGAEVSTTARPSLLLTVSAGGGLATVTVTDVGGGQNSAAYLVCTGLALDTDTGYAVLAFDGV